MARQLQCPGVGLGLSGDRERLGWRLQALALLLTSPVSASLCLCFAVELSDWLVELATDIALPTNHGPGVASSRGEPSALAWRAGVIPPAGLAPDLRVPVC